MGEQVIPNETLMCMHCRYYRDHLCNAYERATQEGPGTLSKPLIMVKESLQFINDPIQLTGNVIHNGTTKFSVWGNDYCSLINVSFFNGTCHVKCTDGMCGANFRNKRNLHTSENRDYTADDNLHICYHLKTFFQNIELVKSFFPDFFNQDNEHEEEHLEDFNYNTQRIKEENTEDGNIDTHIKGNFNTQLGLWEYPAVSQHKPMEMMDPHLVHEMGDQNEYTVASKMNPDTGLYGTYHLMASRRNEDGSEKKCSCGMSFHKDGILKNKGTLYTRNGPVEIKYYDMVCQ